jgi:hypothetical protein
MAAPEPTRAKQIHRTAAGRLFVVDEAGNLFEHVMAPGQYTTAPANRKMTWNLFPRPQGWPIDQVTSGPNGSLDCLAEGCLFTYERDPRVMYTGLQDANQWRQIPLPDAKAPPEPEKPQPVLCWNARGMAGFEPFELGEGPFILQRDQGTIMSLERRDAVGRWQDVQLSPLGRFTLPAGVHQLRAGFTKDGIPASIYREVQP